MENSSKQKTTIILSVSSDIGNFLAKKYLEKGYFVIGTYRSEKNLDEIKNNPNTYLFRCDISNQKETNDFINKLKQLNLKWDTFISAVGYPLPLKSFFDSDFLEWSNSVYVNSIAQLKILHKIYELRNKEDIPNVIFFSSGGINNAVINFSAYTIGKIILIKMCEYLDAENKDLNIFIIGPGWTKTKTHDMILNKLDERDERFEKTKEFMKCKEGTPLEDIFQCIEYFCKQGKSVSSGRNIFVVHDHWKTNPELPEILKNNQDIFKLRRKEKSGSF